MTNWEREEIIDQIARSINLPVQYRKDLSPEIRRKFGIGDIFINAIRCKQCGDIIVSKRRHDFVWCSCHSIAVDGGSWYCKRIGSFNQTEDLSEAFDSEKEE